LSRGAGEVRLRVRLRVRWSFRAISVQSPVHHPSKRFFFEGGVGEVRLRVRTGLVMANGIYKPTYNWRATDMQQ